MSSSVCAQCGQPDAAKRCSRCKQVCYCSAECQRSAWPKHKGDCAVPSFAVALVVRGGGSWDGVTKQTLENTLSAADLALLGESPGPTTLQRLLAESLRNTKIKGFANVPTFDRLVLLTMRDGATYTVEAGLDIQGGKGWWTTKELTEKDMTGEGLQRIDAATLEAQYSGVLGFLETCKTLGGLRYETKTDLDANAMPHVINMIQKLLASSSFRFLLLDDVLSRIDSE